MIAIITVQEKYLSMAAALTVNPEVSIDCPPNSVFTSEKYADTKVMEMMGKANINAANITERNARLAVINYHINKGFRYVDCVLNPPSGFKNQNPIFEYYMEMPRAGSKIKE